MSTLSLQAVVVVVMEIQMLGLVAVEQEGLELILVFLYPQELHTQ